VWHLKNHGHPLRSSIDFLSGLAGELPGEPVLSLSIGDNDWAKASEACFLFPLRFPLDVFHCNLSPKGIGSLDILFGEDILWYETIPSPKMEMRQGGWAPYRNEAGRLSPV
jgi:hypothetical protein